MKINNAKLDILLARKCLALADLREHGISTATLARAKKGDDITTKVIGKMARALGADVTELIQKED